MPPWQKGQSGNPKGRPKGMSAHMAYLIAQKTDNGQALVDFAWSVYKDENAPLTDRIWAHNWLADRGAGKAPLVIEANVQSQNLTLLEMVNLGQLPDEKLFELENILSSAVGEPLLLKPADDSDV